MRMIRWVAALLVLLGPAFSQAEPVEVAPAPEGTEATDETEAKTETPQRIEPPAVPPSAAKAGAYRRPQRFLRDTAPRLTKPTPLRLGNFSRKWARFGRERLAERRRLLWERVKDARNGVPRRREVFQPGGARPSGARNGAGAEVERVNADGEEAR